MAVAKIINGRFSQAKFNAVVEAVNAATVKSGRGYKVRRNSGGTVLDIQPGRAGASLILPFTLFDASDEESAKVRVTLSTVAGDIPVEFNEGDEPPYTFDVTESGFFWAFVTIDVDGVIEESGIDHGTEVPESDEFNAYIPIGSYLVETPEGSDNPVAIVANARYGPVQVSICRNWFSNPPTWGMSFS